MRICCVADFLEMSPKNFCRAFSALSLFVAMVDYYATVMMVMTARGKRGRERNC